MAVAALALLCRAPGSDAASFPANFQESTVFAGLTQPTVVKFASDGRVFVAEKSGLVKVFASLSASTPTVFADLRTNVDDYWDRGLLGMALHPAFPGTPSVFVLYTLDQKPGGPIPSWGDACPGPTGVPAGPGPVTDGCPVVARLSRLEPMSGTPPIGCTPLPGGGACERVLLEGWCQQFPGHSIGTLGFGPDGALYLSAGDGASFIHADYGQDGGTVIDQATGQPFTPQNVCGDPPQPVGGTQTAPTAAGGALRSQSLRRPGGDPAVLNGAILRLDPETGAPLPDNPLFASSDPNRRRIVAYGLRNPFRFAPRPGSSELWVADAGWRSWEEINRIENPLSPAVRNFGWPCHEGSARQDSYDELDLDICEDLYADNTAAAPLFAYRRGSPVVVGESCPSGNASISGLAFYGGGPYPPGYDGALFFTDYVRRCIWALLPGVGGLPDPSNPITFAAGLAGGVVHLEAGPAGDLFYVDFDQGRIQRIRYLSTNQAPIPAATASPQGGLAPLLVQFDGSGSTDPDPGDTLSYAWDLDGDGLFDDSAAVAPARLYSAAGVYLVSLRVSDLEGATAVSAPVRIIVGDLIFKDGFDPEDAR